MVFVETLWAFGIVGLFVLGKRSIQNKKDNITKVLETHLLSSADLKTVKGSLMRRTSFERLWVMCMYKLNLRCLTHGYLS